MYAIRICFVRQETPWVSEKKDLTLNSVADTQLKVRKINRKGIFKMKPDFDKMGGLIPAIVQDDETGEVLMLAYMDQEAWESTLSTGLATYHSRSRNELWVKGKTSGNVQRVKEIRTDCDDDTVLLKVEQIGGAACHTGHRSCFFRKIEHGTVTVVGEPVFDPKEVYR